jgi:hypothetical protein
MGPRGVGFLLTVWPEFAAHASGHERLLGGLCFFELKRAQKYFFSIH